MKTIEDIMGVRAIDSEIVQNRRKLTDVLCKLGQNPVGADYEVVLKSSQRGSGGQLLFELLQSENDSAPRYRWDKICTVTIESSYVGVTFDNRYEPVTFGWLDKKRIRKSFILGRYILVLRPLEELFAHETAAEELAEWATETES